MAAILGVNAVFHDPAAALVVDGVPVAAAEEERFSRRKHGKDAVAFSAWELPVEAMRWCLAEAGLTPADVDAVAYSYDPDLAPAPGPDVTADGWEGLRTLYVSRAPRFLATALPGLRPERVGYVAHHVAHAASACVAAPAESSAVLVLDGRGEVASHLGGRWRAGALEVLAGQRLPHSLGLLYEEVTAHLGFRRSTDEYKVMALASYGDPARFGPAFRDRVRATGDGGFMVEPVDLAALAPARHPDEGWQDVHADLAAAVQRRLEEVVLDLARWLHARTGEETITLAGGVALNCVANGRLAAEGPFSRVWVQPAAGDAGTALGAALAVAARRGEPRVPFTTAALGRGWDDDEIESVLKAAEQPYERPADLAETVAEALATGAVVGWFQGRSEYGPRALGHRSLLCDPRRPENLGRMNALKGREEFRPVAPMVLAERAAEIFDGVQPSPYMLFVHRVDPAWVDRIPAAVHVDGTARIQTVSDADEPLVAAMLRAFERRTGVPVVVNTSFNTAGRPMVDTPRHALECFGSGPIDLLALGPYVMRRARP
ncbi:MAG TPA: carbamoyltransferase C-terminal domain-containing protein [Acidimicrobiales bacterium]|nr:carbamoyltransferase C-terminal domain-containing protein [Acidimicrobiales bacterium]